VPLSFPLSLEIDLATFTPPVIDIINLPLPHPKRIMHDIRLHPIPNLKPAKANFEASQSSARVIREDLFVETKCDFFGFLFD
jgi:hypothetical protein